MTLITVRDEGLYCEAGDFFIDPQQKVPRAVLSHAHPNRVIPGCDLYVAAQPSVALLEPQLGSEPELELAPYGQPFRLGDALVSFHPSGFMIGSAQIRIENENEVCVVATDFKLDADPTCAPFESLKCNHLITGALYGLPIYRWPKASSVIGDIHSWWMEGSKETNLLICDPFGQAQRILAELKQLGKRKVYIHEDIKPWTDIYAEIGVDMATVCLLSEAAPSHEFTGDLILAPPEVKKSDWLKRFRNCRQSQASGLMRTYSRSGMRHGFVHSNHADWPSMLKVVRESEASSVWLTHGSDEIFARYLQETLGLDAHALRMEYKGEEDTI